MMDEGLLNYFTEGLPVHSPQCSAVRQVMLGNWPDDRIRLASVLELVGKSDPPSPDTVTWLVRGIRGHYGGEGRVLEVSSDEEAAFWGELHQRFPENVRLCLAAADSLFISASGEFSEALRLFIRAIELDPHRISDMGGEVAEALQESEFAPRYWVAYGRSVRSGQGEAEFDEWLAELREDLQVTDPAALRQIEEALRSDPK